MKHITVCIPWQGESDVYELDAEVLRELTPEERSLEAQERAAGREPNPFVEVRPPITWLRCSAIPHVPVGTRTQCVRLISTVSSPLRPSTNR